MTSGEERAALSRLAELMAQDPAQMSREELVAALKDAEQVGDDAPAYSRRFIQALLDRDMSYRDIAEASGFKLTRLHRRVNPRPRKGTAGPAT